MRGVYVAGWARKASEGLVGIARHDGETGAARVLQYLAELKMPPRSATPDEIARFLEHKGVQAVSKSDLALLGVVEEREAKARGLTYFKYSDDSDMLSAIEQDKSKSSEPAPVGR
jgi:ferredoxin--NADP+ reductase